MTDVHGALTAQAELLDALVTPDPPPRRGWPFVLLALVLLTAAGAIGVVVVSRDDGPQGPPHPSKWDASIQKYVDFVEKKRDLEFTHPVYVDFLADAEFTENVTADDDDLTDEDRKEIEQSTGLLRALGLVVTWTCSTSPTSSGARGSSATTPTTTNGCGSAAPRSRRPSSRRSCTS